MDITLALDVDAIETTARDLERYLNAEMTGAVQESSRRVRDEARANHSYQDRSGDLTRSIGTLRTTGRATDGDLVGGVIARMVYARAIEEGRFLENGGVIRPYQYLATAYMLHTSDIIQLRDDAVENAVFRAGMGR